MFPDRREEAACLLGGRFRVSGSMLDFTTPPAQFPVRVMQFPEGRAVSEQAAFFESFTPGNFELGVKMVDACTLPPGNPLRACWAFYGGLTNADARLEVRQLGTGEIDVWTVPAGTLPQSEGRTQAFGCED